MKLNESLLCISPEAFKAVDINFALSKSLCMVHSGMPVSAEHQAVVALKPVYVDNGALSYLFHRQIEDGFQR